MNYLGVLQVIVAVGLLNVWLIRFNKSTNYRGGDAKNLKEEFATYGLPPVAFFIVGGLKIASAIVLIAGFWFSNLVFYAALVVAILMVGALAMHIKVKDPLNKSIPAFLMLSMSLALVLTNLPLEQFSP